MEDKYVVALSGGRDSVALLHYLHSQGKVVAAVHIHHGLQAVADEWLIFCQELCESLGVPFYARKVQLNPGRQGVEAAAREARYSILLDYARQYNAKLAIGHHRDDHEETILLQLLRGTGLQGLRGIKQETIREHVTITRPLLAWSREEITQYCLQHQLTWVEDPSNQDTDAYSRNFIRQLLPQLKERFTTVSAALQRISLVATDSLELLDDLAKLDYGQPFGPALNVRNFNYLPHKRQRNVWRMWLQTYHPAVLYDERQLQEWMRMTITPTPKSASTKTHTIHFKKGWVHVTGKMPTSS